MVCPLALIKWVGELSHKAASVMASLLTKVLSLAPANSARPRIRASVSRDVPVYFLQLSLVLIAPTRGEIVQT